MGHGHSHGGLPSAGSAAGRHKGRLTTALALTLAYMAAEVAGGLLTGSLALPAIRFGERAPTATGTSGYLRFELLAALTDAVVLREAPELRI